MTTTQSSGQIIPRTSEIVSNVHGWSSGMSLIAGVPFNILLVVMIFHYTPMRLRDYSPIMLQTCFSDLAILFISELVQPVRNKLTFLQPKMCFFVNSLFLLLTVVFWWNCREVSWNIYKIHGTMPSICRGYFVSTSHFMAPSCNSSHATWFWTGFL